MLRNISTITLSKAQKRWRLAYFSIYFSNTMLSIPKVAANNHSDGFLSIDDQSKLKDLVKNKDLEIVGKFNGVSGLAEALQTDLKNGINGEDTERRKVVFGSNSYKKTPSKGLFYFVAKAFKETTILIMLAYGALSLGFGIKNGGKDGWYQRCSIFVGIFLVIAVSAVSNFRQERQFDGLSNKLRNNIKTDVVREGRRQKISIFDVVVGEVVYLTIGDQVPADGLFVCGYSLVVDESSVTGESDPINIDAIRHPFLIRGSLVVDGGAQMLVTSVGMMMTNDSNEQTPLQSRIKEVASAIVKFCLSIASLQVLITLVRYSTGYRNGMYDWRCADTNDVLESVSRDVSAIAEGLMLAIRLTFAYSTKGMMGDIAMVRKLSACETMGSATVICTHKTGILTKNQMEVAKFWVGFDHIDDDSSSSMDAKVLQLYHQGVGLNTTGSVYKSDEYFGSPTEKAILSWGVSSLGMDIEKLKQDSTVLHVENFNSEKKRSGVLIRKTDDNTLHVHWKGAAEMILAMCSNYYQKTGLKKSLNHKEKTHIEKIIEGMAASGLRCIAFAHKQIPDCADGTAYESLNKEGLTLMGIVGIKNPCRVGAKEAVDTCRSAGVEIKMITGDNLYTAKAIATEIGILEVGPHITNNGEVIEGEEFRNYTDKERMEKVDRIRVMARSSPLDKLLMVRCLKKKGHVVAVTGKGSNDAAALKEADVGFSMGIQGTEVAKENSDIIILDDDFASIAMALRSGRCVYNNIQKFIQFQLPANVVALVLNFIKAASAGGFPFTGVQLLWINLIVNNICVVALATELPTPELTQNLPVCRSAPLITNVTWKNLSAQVLYQMIVLLTLQFGGRSILNVNERVNNTIIFTTFILCQVANLFNSRKVKNMLFLGIVGLVVVLQVVMVEVLNDVADTLKLNREQWGICLAFAASSWAIGWFVKLIPVPKTPFLSYIQGKIKAAFVF